MSRVGTKSGWSGNCIETISTSKTLTGADSGKVFMCSYPASTEAGDIGAMVISLPIASIETAGFNAKFILSVDSSGSDAAETITIDCQTASGITATFTEDTQTNSGTGQKVNFIISAKKGDWIEVICDGTQYYASGVTDVNNGITVT